MWSWCSCYHASWCCKDSQRAWKWDTGVTLFVMPSMFQFPFCLMLCSALFFHHILLFWCQFKLCGHWSLLPTVQIVINSRNLALLMISFFFLILLYNPNYCKVKYEYLFGFYHISKLQANYRCRYLSSCNFCKLQSFCLPAYISICFVFLSTSSLVLSTLIQSRRRENTKWKEKKLAPSFYSLPCSLHPLMDPW